MKFKSFTKLCSNPHKPAYIIPRYNISTFNIKSNFSSLKSLYEESVIKIKDPAYLKKLKSMFIELGSDDSSHVDLKDSVDQNPDHKGKVFKRHKDKNGNSVLIIPTKKEIDEASVFALGGLGQDDDKGISSIGKTIEIIVNPIPQGMHCKPIIYHPAVSRETRFTEGRKYHLDPKKIYYADYIKPITEQYILPHFLSKDKKSIVKPNKDLTIFTFSMGYIESMMIKNYLVDVFKSDFNLSKNDILNNFTRLYGFSLQCMPNYQGVSNLDFSRLIIVGIKDFGIQKVESFVHAVSPKHLDLFKEKEYVFLELSYPLFPLTQKILVLGKKFQREFYNDKFDFTGHGMLHGAASLTDFTEEIFAPIKGTLLEKDTIDPDINLQLNGRSGIEYDN
jgi:hypothetical protein